MIWNKEYDIIVVGCGGAGAAAAIEAKDQGLNVLVIDRFYGGGATANSGGVIYAGGGTSVQKEADVRDTVENMYDYLKLETDGVVQNDTLLDFCRQSGENIEWLKSLGVPFEASLCPFKTSYPTNNYYLYYSGNESFAPYSKVANPAPRGHRVKGKWISGNKLYDFLSKAIVDRQIDFMPRSIMQELIVDDQGTVSGIKLKYSGTSIFFKMMVEINRKMTTYYEPFSRKIISPLIRYFESKYNKVLNVRAKRGVVLATGGFVFNEKMIEKYAPAFQQGLPLGTIADDGSGILAALKIGATTKKMDNVSAWRFIIPPLALVKGLLINLNGNRFVNEQLYGAMLGKNIVRHQSGTAFLIFNDTILKEARSQIKNQTVYFQKWPMEYLFRIGRIKSKTLDGLAKKLNIPQKQLIMTVNKYNDVVKKEGVNDEFEKDKAYMTEIYEGPFYAIDCSIKPSLFFPLAVLTLGGLEVNEKSGQVISEKGDEIAGLYAIGRTAVGICSENYISGLSIADCFYSGRRTAQFLAKEI